MKEVSFALSPAPQGPRRPVLSSCIFKHEDMCIKLDQWKGLKFGTRTALNHAYGVTGEWAVDGRCSSFCLPSSSCCMLLNL